MPLGYNQKGGARYVTEEDLFFHLGKQHLPDRRGEREESMQRSTFTSGEVRDFPTC